MFPLCLAMITFDLSILRYRIKDWFITTYQKSVAVTWIFLFVEPSLFFLLSSDPHFRLIVDYTWRKVFLIFYSINITGIMYYEFFK